MASTDTKKEDDGPAVEQSQDLLAECQEENLELKAENAELRESSESFGALAERLNRAKRSES